MIEIIRLTINDDENASSDIDVMVCSAISVAKVFILDEINKTFDGNWMSLKDAAKELHKNIQCCIWNDSIKEFIWQDNGKSKMYRICQINVKEIDTKFQKI